MEENVDLFIDPEEDEVFFYGISEKEVQIKNILEGKMQLKAKNINESSSNQNYHVSKETGSSLSTFKTFAGLEQITDLNCLSNNTNLLAAPLARGFRNHENITDNCTAAVSYQESCKTPANEEITGWPINQITSETKKSDHSSGIQNKINISIDHNYSTPVKHVIDKSILKTPKSIVKADKDGGFLKVLSEIALVKAEADEDNLEDIKKLTAISSTEELNDDNKENEQSDNDKTNAVIKVSDVPSAKTYLGLTVNKASNESQKKKIDSCSPEKITEDLIDFSILSNFESVKISETVSEQFLTNEKGQLQSFITETVSVDPVDRLSLVKSLSLYEDKSNNPDKVDILLKKPDDNVTNTEIKTTETTEYILNSSHQEEIHCVTGQSCNGNLASKGVENFEENSTSAKDLQEQSMISLVPELKLPAAAVDVENEGEANGWSPAKSLNSSNRERHKKFIRRNTMRLLEELNELVTFEQAKRESCGTSCNTRLSEEAAKVIKKLKAVGFDDSICSPEQYFDLDKLDSSFFSSELSDMLNDTLSKPLSHITSKDVEMLLEKINVSSLEFESGINSDDGIDPKKENLYDVELNENFMGQLDQPEKSKTDSQKFPSLEEEKFEEVSVKEKDKLGCGISLQSEGSEKATAKTSVFSGNKNIICKTIAQPQAVETGPRGSIEFRSVEKNIKSRGLTRIPKLTSTTSKVPVTAKEVKQQLGKPTSSKTPFLKAQKSLKFNNIDSPVSAYINSKTPVTFTSGKGKAMIQDGINISSKKADIKTITRNTEIKKFLPKSETKLNSHLVKFKSGTPLKGNSAESRLPKFVPKIIKGSGSNYSVAAKYEGNKQRAIPKRP